LTRVVQKTRSFKQLNRTIKCYLYLLYRTYCSEVLSLCMPIQKRIYLLNVGFLTNALHHRHGSVYVISNNISVYENDKNRISKLALANETAFQL